VTLEGQLRASLDRRVWRFPCGCRIATGGESCPHVFAPIQLVVGEEIAERNERAIAARAAAAAAEKCAACDGTGRIGAVVCQLCKRKDPPKRGPEAA
jgi:hypothetical protein